jgi:hypothetical protein
VLRSRRPTRPPQRPGWYPDGSGWLRYYDGTSWTELVRERLVLAEFRPQPVESDRAPRARALRPRYGLRVVSVILATLLVGGLVLQLVALTLSARLGDAQSLRPTQALVGARQVCMAHPVTTRGLLAGEGTDRTASADRAAALTELAAEAHAGGLAALAQAWSSLAVRLVSSGRDTASLAAAIAAVDHAAAAVRVPSCRA